MFKKAVSIILAVCVWASAAQAACVVLLHGLARTERSFLLMEEVLEGEGYDVVRPGYPSTSASVEELAQNVLPRAFAACETAPVHVVSHSMGGILLRWWLTQTRPADLGRIVMMGPPNQGSEVVDTLGDLDAFGWVNGPAGGQLGTGQESLPRRLPAVDYPVGVIAGDRSLNPYFSTLLPGADDGKVSVAATRVSGHAGPYPTARDTYVHDEQSQGDLSGACVSRSGSVRPRCDLGRLGGLGGLERQAR